MAVRPGKRRIRAIGGAIWREEGPESPIMHPSVTLICWRAKPDGMRTVPQGGKPTGENGHKPKAKSGKQSNGERWKPWSGHVRGEDRMSCPLNWKRPS